MGKFNPLLKVSVFFTEIKPTTDFDFLFVSRSFLFPPFLKYCDIFTCDIFSSEFTFIAFTVAAGVFLLIGFYNTEYFMVSVSGDLDNVDDNVDV